jgi:predicted CXXCH cytochrome family protein
LIRFVGCAGCHIAGNTGADTVVDDTPIVYHVSEPSSTLAGGDFYFSILDPDKVHGCKGIVPPVETMAPPGFTIATRPAAFPGSGAWGPAEWTSQTGGTQLSCAGEYGCHGDRSTGLDDFAGVHGAHHQNATMDSNQVCDGATVVGSYRFLAGIKGVEQNNGLLDSWERQVSASQHNGYYGVKRGTDADTTATISYLCAECHGTFHSDAGIGGIASPWIRHPTDIAFSQAIIAEFAAYTTYDPIVPVGWRPSEIAVTSSNGMPLDPVVVCLSCHRAHGSENKDLLRWGYNNGEDQPATQSCRTCHTAK